MNQTNIEVPMIMGTDGHKNYMAFARRGNTLLATRPNILGSGEKMGVDGTTFLGARLRSTEIPPEFEQPGSVSNIVPFSAGNVYLPHEPWPQIVFEKTGTVRGLKYASTQIGTFLTGSIKDSPEKLLDQLTEKKFATGLVEYIVSLTGEGYLIIDKHVMIDWLDRQLMDCIKRVKHTVDVQKDIVEIFKNENVGVFGMQAELLKKVQKKHADMHPDKVLEEEPE